MNQLVQNLLCAWSNPHIRWPVLVALGIKYLIGVLEIFCTKHGPQIAQLKSLFEPVVTTLVSYSTLAAANSGPATPPKQ